MTPGADTKIPKERAWKINVWAFRIGLYFDNPASQTSYYCEACKELPNKAARL
jgi:hypothetical protein